jgi:hypothetical protein
MESTLKIGGLQFWVNYLPDVPRVTTTGDMPSAVLGWCRCCC